jgi:hypothetical protein
MSLSLKITIAGFLFVATCLLAPVHTSAQSMLLSPASGSINVGATTTIEIKAVSVPAQTNAFALRLSLPSPISVQSFTPGPKVSAPIGQCETGATPKPSFTTHNICFDGATSAGVYLADGDVLGTVVVRGDISGTAVVTFTTGTKYAYGTPVQEVSYTGTGGTYTVVSSGGTLPQTGIWDEWVVAWFTPVTGGMLIGFGGYLYYVRKHSKHER